MVSAKAQCVRKIAASINAVWAIIGDFAHVNQWVKDVVGISVTGSTVGAHRNLLLNDGLKTTEELVQLDPNQHIISYKAVTSELPFSNYLAVITVKPLTQDSCEVTWNSTFDLPVSKPALVQQLEQNYERYLSTVEKLCQQQGSKV